MDSVASSFNVVGAVVVVVLAGLCFLLCLQIMKKVTYSTQKTKGPSTCQTVPLDAYLSSLQLKMSGF